MTAMPGPMARQLCRVIPLFILATGVLCDAVAQTPPAPAADEDGPNDTTPDSGAIYLY